MILIIIIADCPQLSGRILKMLIPTALTTTKGLKGTMIVEQAMYRAISLFLPYVNKASN
jgi:hypothetical protein